MRVIAATNEDLQQRVKEGTFREDLWFRLRVVPLRLPPLRERREDIPLLVEHFVQKHALRLSRPPLEPDADAMRALLDHPWPGNIRELEHAIERGLLLARGDAVTLADLPPELSPQAAEAGAAAPRGGTGGPATPGRSASSRTCCARRAARWRRPPSSPGSTARPSTRSSRATASSRRTRRRERRAGRGAARSGRGPGRAGPATRPPSRGSCGRRSAGSPRRRVHAASARRLGLAPGALPPLGHGGRAASGTSSPSAPRRVVGYAAYRGRRRGDRGARAGRARALGRGVELTAPRSRRGSRADGGRSSSGGARAAGSGRPALAGRAPACFYAGLGLRPARRRARRSRAAWRCPRSACGSASRRSRGASPRRARGRRPPMRGPRPDSAPRRPLTEVSARAELRQRGGHAGPLTAGLRAEGLRRGRVRPSGRGARYPAAGTPERQRGSRHRPRGSSVAHRPASAGRLHVAIDAASRRRRRARPVAAPARSAAPPADEVDEPAHHAVGRHAPLPLRVERVDAHLRVVDPALLAGLPVEDLHAPVGVR